MIYSVRVLGVYDAEHHHHQHQQATATGTRGCHSKAHDDAKLHATYDAHFCAVIAAAGARHFIQRCLASACIKHRDFGMLLLMLISERCMMPAVLILMLLMLVVLCR